MVSADCSRKVLAGRDGEQLSFGNELWHKRERICFHLNLWSRQRKPLEGSFEPDAKTNARLRQNPFVGGQVTKRRLPGGKWMVAARDDDDLIGSQSNSPVS